MSLPNIELLAHTVAEATGTDVQGIQEALESYFEDRLVLTWVGSDIRQAIAGRSYQIGRGISVAPNLRTEEIPDDEDLFSEILEYLESNYDSGLGVTWDVIDYVLGDSFEEETNELIVRAVKNLSQKRKAEISNPEYLSWVRSATAKSKSPRNWLHRVHLPDFIKEAAAARWKPRVNYRQHFN